MPETPQNRIEANRENAKQSTGPRTPEGKARSSLNAVKHGLRARDCVIPQVDGHDAQESFDALLAEFTDQLQPQDLVEEAGPVQNENQQVHETPRRARTGR